MDVGLVPHETFPVKPVPGEPGTYAADGRPLGISLSTHTFPQPSPVDTGLAPHETFPVKPMPGKPGTYAADGRPPEIRPAPAPVPATFAPGGCGACLT